MKKSKIVIVIFSILLFSFFYIGILAPKDAKTIENENRNLAQMPTASKDNILSGNFSKDYENYLADNIGFRTFFTDISSKIQNLKGFTHKNGKIVAFYNDTGIGKREQNFALIKDNRVMTIYKEKPQNVQKYIDVLNDYRKAISKNTNIISIVVPTSIEFYDTWNVSDNQENVIEKIYNGFDGVKSVKVYENLKNHKSEYLYFRTDHHWNGRGAFYAYQEFSKQIFNKDVSIEDYKENSCDGFLGYMYNNVQESNLENYPDTVFYYTKGKNYDVIEEKVQDGIETKTTFKLISENFLNEKNKYGVFLAGDHQYAQIITDCKNGRCALIIKDSYANAFIPFLVDDYEKIIIVDPRSYTKKITDILDKNKVDDIIFFNNISAVNNIDFVNSIENVK